MNNDIKIGILGIGLVGTSVLELFDDKKGRELLARVLNISGQAIFTFSVWDQNVQGVDRLNGLGLKLRLTDFSSCMSSQAFVDYNDYIVVSPGVDISTWKSTGDKFINELDLFSSGFMRKTIAITGTLGKTTVTHLLEKFLGKVAVSSDNFNDKVIACGNIGKPMLSLITQEYSACTIQADEALLELSSFQLEFNRSFVPDIAIITNCYENHLDRHKTFEQYVAAKFNIMKHHTKKHSLIISSDFFRNRLWPLVKQYIASYPGIVYIVSQEPPSKNIIENSKTLMSYVIYLDQGFVWCQSTHAECVSKKEKIIAINKLSSCTFIQNWLFIIAVARRLALSVDSIQKALVSFVGYQIAKVFPHRLEHVTSINQVDFYNDSKSTVVQSTQAAIKMLQVKNRPITLIVGGLSKGVDRTQFSQWLTTVPAVKKVYCFGKQCAAFNKFLCFSSLEQVLDDILTHVQPGDIVLFSPAGTSFDCFKNYMHRGIIFKQLVRSLVKEKRGGYWDGAKNAKAPT